MKLRDKPHALLGLFLMALASPPSSDSALIAVGRRRDEYYRDAELSDDEKGVVGAALQAAVAAPVTADATAAWAKYAELKEGGDATPSLAEIQRISPAPLHRGVSEDALAAARQELNPESQPLVDSKSPQGPGDEGIQNPVLQEDVEVPTEEQPVKRGPGRPRKNPETTGESATDV